MCDQMATREIPRDSASRLPDTKSPLAESSSFRIRTSVLDMFEAEGGVLREMERLVRVEPDIDPDTFVNEGTR